MAKDISMCNDISPDAGAVNGGAGTDFGGDLADNKGVDLNAGEMAKATMMSCDVPPPPPPVPAEIREIPESQGFKTPEQIAAEMKDAWDYNDPATDNRGIEEQQPLESEYGDSPR